jgi:RimJ/RimL family protein N-acetyltransferase
MGVDERVMEHFPGHLDRSASDALVDRIEASFEDDRLGLWAVELGGAFIGFAGLLWQHPPLPFAPAVEVGWRFAAHAWGHGYATEAGAASIDDGFERLGLEEIVSMTAAINTRSRSVMERLGMQRRAKDDFLHPRVAEADPLAPHVVYRLQRADWPGSAAVLERAAQARLTRRSAT